MTAKPRRKRTAKVKINNPRYEGAKPEDVGRALLRHPPREDAGKQAKTVQAKTGRFQ